MMAPLTPPLWWLRLSDTFRRCRTIGPVSAGSDRGPPALYVGRRLGRDLWTTWRRLALMAPIVPATQ